MIQAALWIASAWLGFWIVWTIVLAISSGPSPRLTGGFCERCGQKSRR